MTIESTLSLTENDLKEFVENKINHYAERIKTLPQRADRSAFGELEFYIALRNVIAYPNNKAQNRYDQASLRDQGMMDAINDTLIKLGLVRQGEKFWLVD